MEAKVLGRPSVLSRISRDAIVFAGCRIPLASKVRSLGVTPDSALSMKQQINTVFRACYFHIRQISRIRKFLSQESVVKPVSCFVLSCLDYCNSLLSGLPIESINQQASKCSKLCRSAHFRHEETQTHHSYSEKSPLAACLSVNPLQAVSFPLQQELRHSSSFIIIYL